MEVSGDCQYEWREWCRQWLVHGGDCVLQVVGGFVMTVASIDEGSEDRQVGLQHAAVVDVG